MEKSFLKTADVSDRTPPSISGLQRPRRVLEPMTALLAGVMGMLGSLSAARASEPAPAMSLRLQDPAHKAHVVIVEDERATAAFRPKPGVVRGMVELGLRTVTGEESVRDAWLSLVTTQDVIGLKVSSPPNGLNSTQPEVAAAVVESLIEAGIAKTNIIIWDKRMADLIAGGFDQVAERLGVRLAAAQSEGYDPEHFYEMPLLGKLIWGDHEFGRSGENAGRKSYVSSLVTTGMTKIVMVTALRNHNLAGVSGNLYNLAMGSVDNTLRFESSPKSLATAIPEIVAMPLLGDRVVLNVVDGLVAQYEGEDRTLLHYSKALNQIRFSVDPLALDQLSRRELQERKGGEPRARETTDDLYRNAALLQIGVNDPRRIQVTRITSSAGRQISDTAPNRNE